MVAHLEGGRPQVIPNSEGNKTTPSVVHYREDEIIAGELAKRQRLLAPELTIYSVKRFVGCRWDEVVERIEGIEYRVVEGPDGMVAVKIGEDHLLPEQVQAETLRKMKETAEQYLGQEIAQAVITCPAYFNDSQRQATIKAAELAGLEALRIINEPTAAALAYGINKRKIEKIAVFDFGGGTFDISILELDRDVFEVKSTCGDTYLGGDVIDAALSRWIIDRIGKELELEVMGDMQVLARIAETAEKIKCELSTLEKTSISLPFIGADEAGPKHFNTELTREQFEELIAPTLDRLREPCLQAMKDAGLSNDDLNAVILVGGSTRIPAVHRLVQEIFNKEPDHSVSPDEAVALGASIQASIMRGDLDEILLLDVTPLSLGIELAGGIFSPLIQRNSSIPTTAHKKFTTVRDNQESVSIHVLQGERRIARENRSLARFRLEGIDPAPREVPEIEVSFNIDANGILNVAAMDLTTGVMQQVKIESYQPTLDNDVKRQVDEAGEKADEDRQFIRKVAIHRRIEEMRQELDSLQRRGEVRTLSEKEERRVNEHLFRVEVALQQDEWPVIESAERELKSVFSEIMMLVGNVGTIGDDDLIFEALDDDDGSGESSAPSEPAPPTDGVPNTDSSGPGQGTAVPSAPGPELPEAE